MNTNTNNGGENNENGQDSNAADNSQNPATEGTKEAEVGGEPTPDADASATTAADSAEPQADAAPAEAGTEAAIPAGFTLTVTGKVQATAKAESGTTLRMALKNAGTENYNNFSYQDQAGKPVSLDRKLTEDLAITAIAKTGGG